MIISYTLYVFLSFYVNAGSSISTVTKDFSTQEDCVHTGNILLSQAKKLQDHKQSNAICVPNPLRL